MSSAAKHVLHEALVWSAVALLGFGVFYFFDDTQGRVRSRRGDRSADRRTA